MRKDKGLALYRIQDTVEIPNVILSFRKSLIYGLCSFHGFAIILILLLIISYNYFFLLWKCITKFI